VGGLLLGMAGVFLVVQDKATTGGDTPPAWGASLVALLSITFGTIYQKRFGGGMASGHAHSVRGGRTSLCAWRNGL
jgi:drug/metabolite transporter (DMT)-like permease